MRYLIVSDIHANLEALDAVLEAAAGAWDETLVLGDLVGYGADPNAVVDRVRALEPRGIVRGNHDKAACGLDDGSNVPVPRKTLRVLRGGAQRDELLGVELPEAHGVLAEDHARVAGTINYELVCGTNVDPRRARRVVVDA